MHCTLTATDFKLLVSAPAAVTSDRAPVATLQNLHIEATPEHIHATGTDLQTTVRQMAPYTATPETTGACCANARKLAVIAKQLPPDATVALRASGERLRVRAGRSEWRLITIPAPDFPQPRDDDATPVTTELDAPALAEALQRVHYAASRDDVRYYLNGVLIDIAEDGTTDLVATDGHRCAHCPLSTRLSALAAHGARQLILPTHGVNHLLPVLAGAERAELTLSSRSLALSAGARWTHTRLVEGRYPDWRRVLPAPDDLAHCAILDRAPLEAALQRVLINSNSKYHGVRLTFRPDELHLETSDEHHASAEDALTIAEDLQRPPAPVTIGVNGPYLLDALRALAASDDDQVRLRYHDNERSILITPADERSARAVIMPMRL